MNFIWEQKCCFNKRTQLRDSPALSLGCQGEADDDGDAPGPVKEASGDFGLTDRGDRDLQSLLLLSSICEICIGPECSKVTAATFNHDQDFAVIV